MCLAAIYWARIARIYYGNTQYDAKAINFDDSFIYDIEAKFGLLNDMVQKIAAEFKN